MTAPVATEPSAPGDTFVPRILVFSTNNISDPGIDLAGSAHMHYSPGVNVIGLPCTSGIRPSWILRALEVGFDGVFVASDGDECAYLPDCAIRSNRDRDHGPEGAQGARHGREPDPRRRDLLGLRRAVHEAHDDLLPGARRAGPGGAAMTAPATNGACGMPEPEARANDYDVLVVGSGIGGMESALKLGDMGYKVLLVEKEASVGGKMILLCKVFPTLDCASCISTPKMASTIHHPNITPMTYSRVDGIRRTADGTFHATVTQKARFVDIDTCTGCQMCETACTVAVPDQFNADLVARRAAYIAFPQAVPKKAVIDRAGSSPCSFTCPAGHPGPRLRVADPQRPRREGVPPRARRDAARRHARARLLRAVRGRLHPRLARGHAADPPPQALRVRHPRRERGRQRRGAPRPNGRRVAIVGSGPTGLTAAWQLARKGYAVKIFEAAPVAGGFLRLAIPSYRLPVEVVERDIDNVTDLGVEIATSTPVTDPAALKADGFDAVLVATGTHRSTSLGVPGEDRLGVVGGTDFLRRVKLDEPMDLGGKRVVVVGGGNVAMDAARTARRLGAASVTVAYRRGRDEMPAHHVEADDAEREGVAFSLLGRPGRGPRRTRRAPCSGLRCTRMRLGEPDASGRRASEPIPGSETRPAVRR